MKLLIAVILLLFPQQSTEEKTPGLDPEIVRKGYPIAEDKLTDYWKALAENGWQFDYPRLHWTTEGFTENQVGVFTDSVGHVQRGSSASCSPKIVQVINPTEALVEIRSISYYDTAKRVGGSYVPTTEQTQGSKLVIVKGVDTTSLSDGSSPDWSKLTFKAIGTETYENALGSTNTVTVLQKFDLPKLPSHPAELGIGVREWTDKSGKFKKSAAFEKLESGKVTLVGQDGKTAEVPLDRLSFDDQRWLQEEMKRRREIERKQQAEERKKRSKK